MKNLEVYFAHPSITYGSISLSKERKKIQHFFRSSVFQNVKIVMPEEFYLMSLEDEKLMEQRFLAIDRCDKLIAVGIGNIISYGVYREMQHALEEGKEVYFKGDETLEMKECKQIKGMNEFEIIYWCTQTHRSYAKLREYALLPVFSKEKEY